MATSFESFYRHFVKAVRASNAAVFAGAGLSRSSGYVDWRKLMKEIADDLGLDVEQETDLIAVAQYHLNKYANNRATLDRLLIEEFTKDAVLSENHRLLANLPIDTVWTTNYDNLVERAFQEAHKRVDVKRDADSLQHPLPGRVVSIYKMHGDIQAPQDAVLTKEDYETYGQHRELFSIKLKGDLVGKTFLFIGFSFTDPNIDYILSRIRALLGKDKGQHYCIMRSPERPNRRKFTRKAAFEAATAKYAYDKTKHDLRVADLRRYGVEALIIERYDQLTEMLRELNRRVHLRDIFISGSADVADPLGADRMDDLCQQLGLAVIDAGLNLVSGVGVAIGGKVVVGAMESLYKDDFGDAGQRLFLRPFPQRPPPRMSLKEFRTRYRTDMISKAGVCVFLSGNKLDVATGKVVDADGVVEEFEIAATQGKYPIPIGATGHASRRLWERVARSLGRFYPGGGVKSHFEVLGRESSTNRQLVEAVLAILRQIKAI